MRSAGEIDAMRAQLEENIQEHGWDPAVDAASRALEWALDNTPTDGERLFRMWMERPATERRTEWIAHGGDPKDWPAAPERPVGSEEKAPARAEAPALRLVTDTTCTATLQGWPIEVVDECVREAGHYNEADPESWHEAEPEPGGRRARWSDSTNGATPHRAGPADEEPT